MKPTRIHLLTTLTTLSLLALTALSACRPAGDNPPPPVEPTATPVAAASEPTSTATSLPEPTATDEPPTPQPTDSPSPTATTEPPPEPTATATTVVAEPTAAPAAPESCSPTAPDMLGPFYEPNAPERSSVGQGHLLSGVVRSAADCAPLPDATVEFWLTGPDGNYGDAYRATLPADDSGAYQFESNAPQPYAGRPPHIHIRVSAPGHAPLITQYYPEVGQTEGQFDLVLIPTEGESSATAEADNSASALPAPSLFNVEWDDHADFAAGLISSEQAASNALPDASVYHIDMQLSDDLRTLTGSEEVRYTNTEEEPLDEIYFRLFPNLTGGSAAIEALSVNGQPVTPEFELQRSAMRVPLPTPLAPGEAVVIALDFTVTVPTGRGGNYGTFLLADDVLALAHFYPLIAVYDDEGWNVEIAPPIGDVVYADSSFYRVRVAAPESLVAAASGVEIDRQQADGRQIVTYAAGPVRDFYIAASENYTVVSRSVGETTINSYVPAGLEAGAEDALTFAAQSLQSFNDRFGPYPFTEFDLVSTTTFALGVEYPGIVAILADLYEQPEDGRPPGVLMEGVVAHEAAHQWFYSVVGNDQVDEPWLDEALAQYATLLYYEDVYGPQGYEGFHRSLEGRWQRVEGADIPIGGPVREYTSQEYGAIVYGRGPLFIEALAQEMGDDSFSAFLQDYYQTHQWGIATGESFQQLAEQHCACDLSPLFASWVDSGESIGN